MQSKWQRFLDLVSRGRRASVHRQELCDGSVVAAQWWADHLRAGHNQFRSHDDSQTGAFIALMVASTHAERTSQPFECQVLDFERYLATVINAELLRLKKLSRGRTAPYTVSMTLGVDYCPDVALRLALTAAGIDDCATMLPTQSDMRVGFESVSVAPGYQQDSVELDMVGDYMRSRLVAFV
jgi:hypothetical protein